MASRLAENVEGLRQRTRQFMARPRRQVRHEAELRYKGLVIFLSIAAAFLLWFTASMRESYSVTLEVPAFVRGVPENQALEALPPSTIEVEARGEGWQLLRLFTKSHQVSLNGTAERVNVQALVAQVLPGALNVERVRPEMITMSLGEKTTRRLPVRFTGRIQPAPPYDTTTAFRITPDSVDVVGAASVVGDLQYWPTEAVERNNIRSAFELTVPLSDTLAGLVRLSTNQITLSGRVEQFTEVSRRVRVEVTDMAQGAKAVTLMPDHVQVMFSVPLSQFNMAENTPELYAVVPYEEIFSDTTGQVIPTLHWPDSLVVKDVRLLTRRLQYYTVLE